MNQLLALISVKTRRTRAVHTVISGNDGRLHARLH
jgi:hypothetical protein